MEDGQIHAIYFPVCYCRKLPHSWLNMVCFQRLQLYDSLLKGKIRYEVSLSQVLDAQCFFHVGIKMERQIGRNELKIIQNMVVAGLPVWKMII